MEICVLSLHKENRLEHIFGGNGGVGVGGVSVLKSHTLNTMKFFFGTTSMEWK